MAESTRAIILLVSQVVVFVGLAVLVGLGHDSTITDALLAVSGSIVGVGAFQVVKGRSSNKSE